MSISKPIWLVKMFHVSSIRDGGTSENLGGQSEKVNLKENRKIFLLPRLPEYAYPRVPLGPKSSDGPEHQLISSCFDKYSSGQIDLSIWGSQSVSRIPCTQGILNLGILQNYSTLNSGASTLLKLHFNFHNNFHNYSHMFS